MARKRFESCAQQDTSSDVDMLRWQRRLHTAFGTAFGALAGALMLGLRRLEALRLAPEIDLAVLEEMLGSVVAFDEALELCMGFDGEQDGVLSLCNCTSCAVTTIKMFSELDDGECLTILGRRPFSGTPSITFLALLSFRENPLQSWMVSLGLCADMAYKEMWISPRPLFKEHRGPYRLVFDFVPATKMLSVFQIAEHDGALSCAILSSEHYESDCNWTNIRPIVEMYYGGAVQIMQ